MPAGNYYVNNISGANFRSDSSTSASILAALSKGTIVYCTGTTASVNGMIWAAVQYNGNNGFIAASLLSPVQDNPTPQPSDPGTKPPEQSYDQKTGCDLGTGTGIDFSTWTFPLAVKPSASSYGPGGAFGSTSDTADRGTRAHAAIDLDVPVGTAVLAMTSGTIIFSGDFWGGTWETQVKNDNGSIARYGEINAEVTSGRVSQGQRIGHIITNTANGSHVLHLELYAGTVSGPLTNTSNHSNYTYVISRDYQRRSDLLNPTFVKDLPLYKG